jgi:DNA repair exonuclease SbcCD ATPase subunit
MSRKYSEIRFAIQAARAQRTQLNRDFHEAEQKLSAVSHRRTGLRDVAQLREELDSAERTIRELENSVVTYHQARTRAEHLRGEIVAWRDFQVELDCVEQIIRSLRQRENELDRLIQLLEELANEELEGL